MLRCYNKMILPIPTRTELENRTYRTKNRREREPTMGDKLQKVDTLDSAITRSAKIGNAECLKLDLEPRIHTMEDLSSKKSVANL